MVGKRRYCDINHPSPPIWKDPCHGYGEVFFLYRICQEEASVSRAVCLERGNIPPSPGNIPCDFLQLCRCKRYFLPKCQKKICQIIEDLYNHFDFLLEGNCLNDKEKAFFHKISYDMEDYAASTSLKALCRYLSQYYGKNVIILLDEYDTPLQEAYIHGYWQELMNFLRNLFNSTFKTNPYLERAIMTGITRVSRESVFSDLNKLVRRLYLWTGIRYLQSLVHLKLSG